jgi:hypothetical protein
MSKYALVFSVILISSAQAYVKDCTGTSDQGQQVEVRISTSTLKDPTLAPLQGYYQADVLVDGNDVYSTPYIAYNPADDEYFTAGNSDLVLNDDDTPSDQLYLHVWNGDGSVAVPSFDTVSVTCE